MKKHCRRVRMYDKYHIASIACETYFNACVQFNDSDNDYEDADKACDTAYKIFEAAQDALHSWERANSRPEDYDDNNIPVVYTNFDSTWDEYQAACHTFSDICHAHDVAFRARRTARAVYAVACNLW